MEQRIQTIEISSWLEEAVPRLASISTNPGLDAQVLVSHILNQSRTWIASHLDYQLNIFEIQELNSAFEILACGEPLPYILGHWEFFCLDFFVSPKVLIPRPETELLIEEALKWLSKNPNCSLAADVGTGSGCIAISIAHNFTPIKIIATDISYAALKVATRNRSRHFLSRRIQFVQANLLKPFSNQFSLICANLPYIPSDKLETLLVRHYEPVLALDGGSNGLDLINKLLWDAKRLLAPNGLMLLEIEEDSGMNAMEICRDAFPDSKIELLNDLWDKPRLIRIERI